MQDGYMTILPNLFCDPKDEIGEITVFLVKTFHYSFHPSGIRAEVRTISGPLIFTLVGAGLPPSI